MLKIQGRFSGVSPLYYPSSAHGADVKNEMKWAVKSMCLRNTAHVRGHFKKNTSRKKDNSGHGSQ